MKCDTPDTVPDSIWSVMKRYLLFLIGLFVSTSMYLITGFTQMDYLKIYIRFLTGFEEHHLEGLVIPVSILFFFSIGRDA